jgi:hypothetical protein
MTMTDELLSDHLRRTLHAVAVTVTDEPRPEAPPSRRRPPRRGRRLAVAAVGLAGASGLGLVAWDRWEDGEIRRIPTEAALMEGTATSGGDWWLLPSTAVHEVACPAQVEFVSAASNQVGAEWNTGGVGYGEFAGPPQGCPDPAPWLLQPARFNLGSTTVGPSADGWAEDTDIGWFGAFHPTVTHLRVTVPDGTASVVATAPLPDDPDGPRYAGFTTPPGTHRGTRVALLRADGSIVLEWISRS